jgi:hypothetical protein
MNIWEAPIIIVGIIFFTIGWIIKTISDHRLRNRLIDKGLVNEKVQHLFASESGLKSLSSLKWGMVLVAIGAAALISQLLPYYADGEITIGLMFVFAGAAFLIYYPIADKRIKEWRRQQDQTSSEQSHSQQSL